MVDPQILNEEIHRVLEPGLRAWPCRLEVRRERWRREATERYPDGLPEPYSDDPTQWLFHGDPSRCERPLQAALARLVGYRWPEETCPPEGAKAGPASRRITAALGRLDAHADDDGIVPLAAGRVDDLDTPSAADRLRALLRDAFGGAFDEGRLLAQEGAKSATLENWLRDEAFAAHCALFGNRPFVWHAWDGVKEGGFHAFVHYHRLDRALLTKLAYTVLGGHLDGLRGGGDAPGVEKRLAKAEALRRKLEAILDGEMPLDVYVRWKPLARQAVGWEPDLDDGVRMNVRPFVRAEILRTRFTVSWNKDRGTNPDGSERLNDVHLSKAEKLAARERAVAP